MNKENRDLEIDPEFYKRMKKANIKFEQHMIDSGSIEVNDKFGVALIIFGLIIFIIIVMIFKWLNF